MVEIKKEEILKNSFWNLATSLLAKAGSLIFTIIIARVLLPELFGIYSIALTIVTIVVTLFDLGVNQALVKFFSEKLSADDETAQAYYHYLLKVKFWLSVFSSLLLIILARPLADYLFRDARIFFPIVFSGLLVFTLSIDSFFAHLFYAMRSFKHLTFKELLSQIVKLVFIFLFFLFFEKDNYVVGAILSVSIASIFSFCYMLIFKKNPRTRKNPPIISRHEKKNILKFAFFVGFANLANTLLFYMDSLILSLFVRPDYVGYYRAAFSLVLGVAGIGVAPVLVLLPYLTKMDGESQKRITSIYLKAVAFFSIPASLFVITFARYFIVLFFGIDYIPAQYPLMILSSTIFLQIVVSSIFFNVFAANGLPNLFFKQTILTTALNGVLNLGAVWFFIQRSPLAALIASSLVGVISWIFYFSYSLFVIKKKMKIKLNFGNIILPITSGMIVLAGARIILNYFDSMNVYLIIACALVCLILYVALLYLEGFFKKDEIEFIKNIFSKNIGDRIPTNLSIEG